MNGCNTIREKFGKCLDAGPRGVTIRNTVGKHPDIANCESGKRQTEVVWNQMWDYQKDTGLIRARHGPTIYAKGTYGSVKTTEADFNRAFWRGPGIIRRDCESCSPQFQTLFYKRHTMQRTFNATRTLYRHGVQR